MNIHSKHPTTPDEFLRWNEGREGRREFVDGRVVELMINVTHGHVKIATNLILVFGPQLDRNVFTVGTADFGVRTPDGVRYPDIFIDRQSPHSKSRDLAATDPVLLAEILSPSYGRDPVEKAADYRGIGSLLYHLVLSQEEPRVWLWSKGLDDWGKPLEIAGEEANVALPALNLSLNLGDAYLGVEC